MMIKSLIGKLFKRKRKLIKFKDLRVGTVFMYDNKCCIKLKNTCLNTTDPYDVIGLYLCLDTDEVYGVFDDLGDLLVDPMIR